MPRIKLLELKCHCCDLKENVPGVGIAQWKCVGLPVLRDAASWVRSSSEESFSSRGDFFPWIEHGF